MQQLELNISGRVQGVFFRSEARDKAIGLNLTGYAKNNRDGSVTVVAVGDEKALDTLLEWCQTGTPPAKIDTVEILYRGPVKASYTAFETY